MIKGLGIDLVDLNRITIQIAKRVLSLEELVELNELDDTQKTKFIGTRFAVKEALYKATGTTLSMSQVTLTHDENGKPFLKEFPEALVSISHEKKQVIAIVIDQND